MVTDFQRRACTYARVRTYVRKVSPWRLGRRRKFLRKMFFHKTGLTGGQSARVLPIRGKCERIRDNDITRFRTRAFERGSLAIAVARVPDHLPSESHVPPSIRRTMKSFE